MDGRNAWIAIPRSLASCLQPSEAGTNCGGGSTSISLPAHRGRPRRICGLRFWIVLCMVSAMTGFMQAAKRDYRSQPFRVAVALGASVTAGGTATSPELTWASLLARLISESQMTPFSILDNGIGANLISQRSTLYEQSQGPSAPTCEAEIQREFYEQKKK